MWDNPDARCGRCRHLYEGRCEAALELLLCAGFPHLDIRPNPDDAAPSCPDFESDYDEALALDGARAQNQREETVAAARHFSHDFGLFRS